MKKPIVNQGAFTSVAEIKKDQVIALRTDLERIGAIVDLTGCPIDFNQLTTVHFMRWVILDETHGGDRYELPPYLVLSTNYDLPLENHLKDLIAVGGQTLRKIYSHCEDFDPVTTDLFSYLSNRQVPYAAFYVGTRGRTVKEIEQENQLREGIEEFLDRPGYDRKKSPLDIRKDIQDFVANDVRFQWTKEGRRSELQWRQFFYGTPVIMFLLFLLLFFAGVGICYWWFGLSWWLLMPLAAVIGVIGVSLIIVLAWLVIVVIHERREVKAVPPKVPIMGAHMDELVKREDQIVQNQLSNIVWIKPGWFRLTTLKLVLALINFLGRYYFVRGALGGIPTIHFARWVILNEGRRVLFLSNFDGSWENYLGDFIDKAARGLTAIWSNCIGCPPAHRLTEEGARDEPFFKFWVRQNQLVTQVWYSKHEELSVVNINNNSLICLGLFGEKNLEDTKQWLARI